MKLQKNEEALTIAILSPYSSNLVNMKRGYDLISSGIDTETLLRRTAILQYQIPQEAQSTR